MTTVIFNFFLFFFLAFFNGYFFLKTFKNFDFKLNIFEISLFGIIITGLFAQIINFFFPLSDLILIFNLFIILTILIIKKRKINFIKKVNFIYIILFLLVIANIYGSKFSDDLNHYHYGYIINSDNTKYIWGMSHLNEMYSFSPIWLISQSYFNFDYSRLQDIHILNGLILFIFLSLFYKEISNYFQKQEVPIIAPVLFFIFIFVLIKYTRLKEFGIDMPIFLILYFFILFSFKTFFSKGERLSINITLLTYLSIFMIFNKLLFVFTGFIPLFFILRHKKFKLLTSKYFVPIYLLTFSYFIKNLLISGCFIFPLSFTCVDNLSWSAKIVAENQLFISEVINKSWSEYKGQLSEAVYVSNFNWFPTWFARNKIELFEFLSTSLAVIILTAISFNRQNYKIDDKVVTKYSELLKLFLLIIFFQMLIFFFKNPVIRMSHYIFIFSSIVLILSYFGKFELNFRVKIIYLIIFLAITFNLLKNIKRISNVNFVNNPYLSIKPLLYNQINDQLNGFNYYLGWYGKYPVANNHKLSKYYKHKKILNFDVIYKTR